MKINLKQNWSGSSLIVVLRFNAMLLTRYDSQLRVLGVIISLMRSNIFPDKVVIPTTL